jgi:hypothetical protein
VLAFFLVTFVLNKNTILALMTYLLRLDKIVILDYASISKEQHQACSK